MRIAHRIIATQTQAVYQVFDYFITRFHASHQVGGIFFPGRQGAIGKWTCQVDASFVDIIIGITGIKTIGIDAGQGVVGIDIWNGRNGKAAIQCCIRIIGPVFIPVG